MIQRRGLIPLGLIAFVWTLLFHAPAATLYGWFASKNSGVQLLGIEGSLGAGSLAGVASNGSTILRDLHWRMQPWWLLLARASFQLDSGAPIAISGRAGISPFARHVSNAHISASLKSLLGSAGIAYLPIDGLIDGDIASLTIRHGIPTAATAALQLRGLNWSLAKPPMQLGDFRADIRNDNDAIVANIQSTSGPIEAQGLARLNADGSYDSDIRLKAKPEADPSAQNLLHSLGQPDAQGYYHAHSHGQLPGAASQQAGVPPASH